MTDAEPPHRSRFGWPTQTEPTTTPAGTHSHKQSNGPLLLAFLCIVLLFLANVGLIWFILARGAARDAAEERARQLNRDSWCRALDAFPADNAFLDPLRDYYDCGPGLPADQLSPEQQAQIRRPVPPPAVPQATTVPLTPSGAAPALGDSASTDAPPAPTQPGPPPRPTDPPPPSPAPDPLGPITDRVCDLAGVCL